MFPTSTRNRQTLQRNHSSYRLVALCLMGLMVVFALAISDASVKSSGVINVQPTASSNQSMDDVPTIYATANAGEQAQFSKALLASAMAPLPASISDSIALTDPTFVRPSAAGTTGVPTLCPASGNPTVHYKLYEFNLAGCAVGGSPVTVDTCSSAIGLDTVVFVYRQPGGAPSTPGSPTFFPTSPCTNVVVSNNNNSLVCAPGSGLSSVTTTMTDGNFVVVVATANTNQTGNFVLSVTSPTCAVTQIQSCNATLDHNADSFVAAGGSGSVNVAIGSTCAWTAVSNDSWITVTSGAAGLGNGTVGFTVDPNSGDARTGSITIAGLTFNVTQEAGAVALPCIHDALVDATPTFVRPSVAAAGTISCPASGNPTTHYKAYEFDLSCAGSVTASTCVNGVCPGPVTLADTIVVMYRKSDGSPSSPGSPIFNPATPCANAVIGNNNSALCGAGSTLSSVTQSLPAGKFVVVVTSSLAGDVGTFKLNVTSNTPGCNVTIAPACGTATGTVTPSNQTICPGGSGTVNVTVSGGTAPYTVSLNNGGGTQTGFGPSFNFTVSPASTTTYTATGTDANGCPITMSGTATVTVEDTTDPVITCPANVTTSADANQCSATVDPGTATATDTCPGTVTVVGTRSDSQPLNAPYPVGTTTITWTATDANGNDASCQQTVTVNDNQNPTITCPANIVTSAGPTCTSDTDPGTATASDNCPGVTVSGSRSDSQPLNDPYPLGTTTITWTATDASGNTATCTQTYTVNDTTPPVVTCPAPSTASADPSTCTAPIPNVASSANATDNCSSSGSITKTQSPAAGTPVGLGTHTITVTATDQAGNSSTCTTTFTVTDSSGPALSFTTTTLSMWPPNHNYQTFTAASFGATAGDACGGVSSGGIYIVSVTSDEVENGNGDGNTLNDIVIAADCKSVQLRAERQNNGDGRVYTIVFGVTDSSGNVTTGSVTVTVPKSQNGAGAVNSGPQYGKTCP